MGVYHITYTPQLKTICLYMDGGCDFSCHGCITDFHPEDCHIKDSKQTKNRTLTIEEVVAYLKHISFEKVIFLGKEPTMDSDFLPLGRILKEKFYSYNILLTNGYRFVKDTSIIDEVCVSIKAISKELFENFTGKDNPEQVLENFKGYVNSRLLVRAESVFIPNYLDERNIEKIACFISKVDKTIPYRIDAYIPFNNDKFRRPTEAEMNKAKIIAEKYLENVSILHKGIKIRYPVKRIY